jgi:hypothetical protein
MKPNRRHVFVAKSVNEGLRVVGTLATAAVAACMVACGGGGSGTGLSVTDGVTRIGAWQASSQEGWEYSVDDQRSWRQGAGDRLAVLGHALPVLSLRQVDLAGNLSPLERVNVLEPGSPTWHEASGHPPQPSTVSLLQALTVMWHGSVVRGDADCIRWNIPAGQRLQALRPMAHSKVNTAMLPETS